MMTAADQCTEEAAQKSLPCLFAGICSRIHPHQQRNHDHGQNKKRNIVHGTVIPVEAFHLIGHPLHDGKREQRCGKQGRPPPIRT